MNRTKIECMRTSSARSWLAISALALLALTGCGAESEPVENPHTGQSAPAGANETAEDEASVAPELSRQEAAVRRGSQRAGSFGFDKAQAATAEELKQLRDSEAPQASGVHPAQCADALATIDSSPAQLSEQSARIDFGSDTFTGTGTVEAAVLEGAEASDWLAEFRQNVQTLTSDCEELEFVVDGQKFAFTTNSLDTEADTVGLSWQRKPLLAGSQSAAQEGTVNSQVMVAEQDGALFLVSFIGDEPATSGEFTQIGQRILAAMKEEK